MESINKYIPSSPLLKPFIHSIVFWRRSAYDRQVNFFLPNNVCGFGLTLSGGLHVKNDLEFKEMPVFGTRNLFEKSSEIKTTGDFFNISIRLIIPNGLCLFTKMPMDLIYEEESFSMDAIFDRQTILDLTEKLLGAQEDHQKRILIEAFLISKLVNTYPPSFKSIIEYIHLSNGFMTVLQLAKQFSISERSINRYFSKYVGVSPIAYINLIRFRSVIRLANITDTGLLGNAMDVGYYDQSHFIKRFKKFSSITPGQFFKLNGKSGLSDFYNI